MVSYIYRSIILPFHGIYGWLTSSRRFGSSRQSRVVFDYTTYINHSGNCSWSKILLCRLKTLFKGHPNMDSLIALGTSAAFIYSLGATIAVWFGYVSY